MKTLFLTFNNVVTFDKIDQLNSSKMLAKFSCLDQKQLNLSKIKFFSILFSKIDFSQNYSPKSIFLNIILQNRFFSKLFSKIDFSQYYSPKSIFLKICQIFCHTQRFLINQKFGHKSKFWSKYFYFSKIEILVTNISFQKSTQFYYCTYRPIISVINLTIQSHYRKGYVIWRVIE